MPVSVRPGEPTKFEVEVKGPVRSVKWYKNGREMEQPVTEQDGNCYRLIIHSAGPDDEADYKVDGGKGGRKDGDGTQLGQWH